MGLRPSCGSIHGGRDAGQQVMPTGGQGGRPRGEAEARMKVASRVNLKGAERKMTIAPKSVARLTHSQGLESAELAIHN